MTRCIPEFPMRYVLGAWLLASLAACGGEPQSTGESASGGAPGTPSATTPETPPATTSDAAASGAGADPTNPRLVASGDSIFHGLAGGGTCMTCHGQKGTGGSLGPSLADQQWLHGDGSYEFIVRTVTTGVPTPKQAPAAMPPMGGAPLGPDQVRAVAAYVYSISRGGRGG